MSVEEFRQSRDNSSPVRTYLFETTGLGAKRYAYTDGPDKIILNQSGRNRLALTLDLGVQMGILNRIGIAKSVIFGIIERIRVRVADGETWDLYGSRFGNNTSSKWEKFNVTSADLTALRDWFDSSTVSTQTSTLYSAVETPSAWFNSAGAAAKKRDWIIFTAGESSGKAAAFQIAQPLISVPGDVESGYIPTRIHVCTIRNADSRSVDFLGNTTYGFSTNIEAQGDLRVFTQVVSQSSAQVEYMPWAIELSSPKVAGVVKDKNSLTIVMGKNCGLGDYYKFNDPVTPMYITIREGEFEDTSKEFPYSWVGRVVSCKRYTTSPKIELTCEPVNLNFKRNGLRRHFQYSCPLELYGPMCRASKSAASKTFLPSDAAWGALPEGSKNLPVPSAIVGADTTPWVGGVMEWTRSSDGSVERATILKVNTTGTIFTVNKALQAPYDVSVVRIIYGCARTPDFCATWHKESATLKPNIPNFGGQDKIPTTNPFRFVNRYN